jgi:folylpolyglutamate synthase/dihydropteroate synthase
MKNNKTNKSIRDEKLEFGLYEGKDDLRTKLAKDLAKNPKSLKDYKKHVIREFNKNKELYILLLNLKTIAMAEAIAELIKKTKRPNIDRFLSENNPSVEKLIEIADDLGITRISEAA